MMQQIENGSELSSIVFQQKGNELVLTVFLFTAEGKLSKKKNSALHDGGVNTL